MEQALRFKAMYARLGFSVADVAQFLQVSTRTVHEWISGRVRIPFAAYKLLRVQLHYELPGDAWNGWCLSAGRLYTPEGHELHPKDFTWWSLLVRKAAMFSTLYAQLAVAGRTAPGQDTARRPEARAWPGPAKYGPTDAVGRPAQPAGPNSFLEHFRKWESENRINTGLPALSVTANQKEACVAQRRFSKKEVRKAKLDTWTPKQAFEATRHGEAPQIGPVNIAADLRRLAAALPSDPVKGPGRPRKVVQAPLTRQQRRYRDRMVAKAAEAWDKVTEGAGVVLVDGKPVDLKGGA